MPAKSLRAVVYLRVSTERQARNGGDEGYSIPAQREACLRKAEALGAEVVEEYADRGESARSADRASLQQMLERIESKGDINYVIVHKVDRLARNRKDDVEIGFRLREAGAQLVSCAENIDETPSGVLLHSIMAGIAEFYSRNLAAEVKKGLHQKAKAGGTPTQAPIGYLNTRGTVDGQEIKTVTQDDERGPHIRWAFETFAAGDWSLSDITDELEARGLRRRPTARYDATPLSRSQVHRMLRNPYYVGIVRYAGVDYVGNHEPLVDLPTWQQAQEVLSSHRVASDRPSKHKHYLIGSLYCGHCGGRLGLSASRGRHGGVYKYFFCIAGNKKRTDCQQGYIPTETIEQTVADYYLHVEMSKEDLEEIAAQMTAHVAVTRKLAEKEVSRQQVRLQRLDAERRKLLKAHYADAIPLDLLREEQARIGQETEQAERILAACEGQFALIEANLDRALAVLESCAEVYRRSASEGRRKLNQALFEKIFVVDDLVTGVDLAAPFHELTDHALTERIEREETLELAELLADEVEQTVTYERRKGSEPVGETFVGTLSWHPKERPGGPLPVDRQNPAAYCRRRGSNKTLLAEGGGFEPPGPVKARWFSRPVQSSALPSLRRPRYASASGAPPRRSESSTIAASRCRSSSPSPGLARTMTVRSWPAIAITRRWAPAGEAVSSSQADPADRAIGSTASTVWLMGSAVSTVSVGVKWSSKGPMSSTHSDAKRSSVEWTSAAALGDRPTTTWAETAAIRPDGVGRPMLDEDTTEARRLDPHPSGTRTSVPDSIGGRWEPGTASAAAATDRSRSAGAATNPTSVWPSGRTGAGPSITASSPSMAITAGGRVRSAGDEHDASTTSRAAAAIRALMRASRRSAPRTRHRRNRARRCTAHRSRAHRWCRSRRRRRR